MAALALEDLQALSANLQFAEITVKGRDDSLDPIDLSNLLAKRDEIPLASLADEGLDSLYAVPPPMLELKAFGKSFTIDADAPLVARTLAYGYSVAGWDLFEELAGEARRGAAKLGPVLADAIEQAIIRTEHSIGALAGNYLLSLEAAAEKLLARVLAERIAYCDATLAELIDASSGVPKLRLGDDGKVVRRARRIVTELDGVRMMGDEIARIHRENAEPEFLVKSIRTVKLSLDPFGAILGDFGSPPVWIESAASLIGLDEASLNEKMHEPRARIDAAITIACGLRTKLILRESWITPLVDSQVGDPPAGDDMIAVRIAQALAEARAKCVGLKQRLAKKELTVRDRSIFVDSETLAEAPMLEAHGYYVPGQHPEAVLADILDGGALSPGPMMPSQYTLWNLAPLVTRADRDLRSAETDETRSALLAAVLPSLRGLRLKAVLRKSAKDMGFGLFLAVGTGLLGPAGAMVYASLTVIAGAAEGVMTYDKWLLETTIEKSDLVGAHSTLVRLLDHSPDVLELVFSAANLAGSVLAIFPRLRQLEKALNLATLGLAGASVAFSLLALALEPDAGEAAP